VTQQGRPVALALCVRVHPDLWQVSVWLARMIGGLFRPPQT
jgi:hypothetical protein